MGRSDFKNVNLGTWREATDNEINTGHVPDGATLRQVITVGGDKEQTLLTKSSQAEAVTVVQGDPKITYNADGSKNYIFPVASGYKKSTCATSGIPDCGSGSARFVIKPNGTNSVLIYAYDGNSGQATHLYWSGYLGEATIDYRVSTGPNGKGPQIKVKSYTPEETTTQKYGYFTHIPASAEEDTKVFLTQKETTAVQNFAFEGMDDFEFD